MPGHHDDGESASPACGAAVNLDAFDTSSEDESPNTRQERVADATPAAAAAPSSFGRTADANEGMVAVQTLEGTKFVKANAASLAGKEAEETWKTVDVQFYLSASLNELAEGAKAPELKISEHVKNAFGETNGERSKNHICGGISIVDIGSTFPVSLHLDVAGLDSPAPAKCMTADGSSGACTIRPHASFSHPVGKEIFAGNKAAAENSVFLKAYSGYTLDSVENGITYVEDEDGEHALIKKSHPVIGLFNDARHQIGQGPLTEADLLDKTQLYIASAADTRKCLNILKGLMQKRLQIQNLYGVSFKLRRASGEIEEGQDQPAWNDLAEVGDGIQGQQSRERMLSQQNKLYVTAQYKYKSLGSN
jgi:hypothetical protein